MATYTFEDGLIPTGWTQSAGSTAPWSVVATGAYAGTYCLKAGTITHSQNSFIECTKYTPAGNVTFYWKVSSEGSYDLLRFYIDGVEDTSLRKSGTQGWLQYTKAVTAGQHTFKWGYTKDSSSSVGSDTAWLDNIVLPDVAVPAAVLSLTPLAPFLLPIMPYPASLNLNLQAPFILPVFIPSAALDLLPVSPKLRFDVAMPAASFALTATTPGYHFGVAPPAVVLGFIAKQPLIIYTPPQGVSVRNVYRAYLTGDAETPPVADLELPLASFQSTRRNAEQTYLYIVVPNPVPYIAEINARLNGDVVIYSGFAIGDTETLTELLRVNFESFRYDLGARSGSASLSGHKQVTYSNPKTRALSGVSYKSVTDGIRLARCEPDMWLNPGDTADLGDGETFVVDSISYTISPRLATMEVSEVEA